MNDLECMNLAKTYLQFKPTGKSQKWDAKEFWEATKAGKGIESPFGFMVAQYEFRTTWTHWECHPKGDELLIAIEGSMQLVLEIDGKETMVALEAPSAFLVPAGTWHSGNVAKPCRVIGISAGEGTMNRPR